jgi:hypothetical protein
MDLHRSVESESAAGLNTPESFRATCSFHMTPVLCDFCTLLFWKSILYRIEQPGNHILDHLEDAVPMASPRMPALATNGAI